MKKSLILFTGAAMLLASCSSGETEETVETTEYVVDTATSTLWWRGEENAEHFHYGYISISEGSLTAENGIPVSGSFAIDPNSIDPDTEGYPEEKLAYLASHLKDTAFLFTAAYPEVKVTTGKYKNGKLNTTIEVLGATLQNDIPLTLKTTDDGKMMLTGDFTIDFADSKMKYVTEIDPEKGTPGAKSKIQFKLDLHLSKK